MTKARRTASAKRRGRVGATPAPPQAVGKREAILAAALEEFATSGFAATRLDDVAKRAGVAKGTIYLYFRDKDDLFQELVRGMLTPIVGNIAALGAADFPISLLGDRIAELFVREIYGTRRKDVIRLMIAEGPRFPKLAEFYYREVISPVMAAMQGLLQRAAARGEVSADLAQFPQIVAAGGVIAVVWSGLFERFAPLDAKAMIKTHLRLLFPPGGRHA